MPQSTIPALDKATRWALKKGYLDLVRSLRGESEDENKYVHAISWAAKRGYLPLVKILLSLPQSIRNKWRREYGRNGETDALEWAARMGYTEIVKLLVKYGDPKNNNSYAYQRAVENGHKEVAGILAPLSDPEIVKKSKKTKESIRRVRSGKVLRESVNKKTYEKQKLRNKQDEKQNSEISKMKHAVLRVIESATEATSEFDEFGYNDDPDTDIEGGETEEYIAELIADCLADHQDEVSRIESFESAGVMTKNVGIVLSMRSGKRFQIQIVEA